MNRAVKYTTLTLAGFCMFQPVINAAHAQQATPLRRAIGVAEQNNSNEQSSDTQTSTRATNAPQPAQLLSNQPQAVLPPPPPPPRRPRETNPFEPLGIRAGSFRFFPVLEIAADVSDNVRSDPSGKQTDVGLRLAPSFRLESNWSRHSLNITASSENVFYAKANDVNSATFNTTSELRLDINSRTTLTNTVSYELSETASSSSEVPGTAIGNRSDHAFSFSSAFAHRFNRLIATLTAGLDWQSSDDVKLAGGGKEDNADREFFEPSARFRLGYEVSPAIIPFAEVGYTPRIHAKTRDRDGIERDSQGLVASTGLAFDFSSIWDGEVSLTYEHRQFKDSILPSANVFGVNATVNWRPTQLTTVSLVTTTEFQESAGTNSAGTRNYNLALDFNHQFRENLTGTLNLGLNYDDFVSNANDDVTYTLEAGFAYAIRREIEWTASYQYTYFKSGIAGGNTSENRISTGVRFRL